MIDDMNEALKTYDEKWRQVVASRKDKVFFPSLKPTAVGWKTEDRAEYDRLVRELHDKADLVVEKWMNGRWVAKVHLKDERLENGIEIVKIMQRRPGSTDAVGLDHVDFYASTNLEQNKSVLSEEPDLKWSEESNDVVKGYDWLSVWFEATEAKIKSDTILDIVCTELQELSQRIIGK